MSTQAKILFVIVYVLVALGVVMTYSASAVYAEHVYGNASYFLLRQLLFAGLGTIAMFAVAMTPIAFWRKHAREVIIISIALMMMVFLPGVGRSAGGARRWISLGAFNFQPVEFAKITVCLYVSDYLTRKLKPIRKGGLLVFAAPLLLVGLICGLSLLQPDLGSCFIVLVVTGILFFLAGMRLIYIGMALAFVVPVLYFLVVRVPYRLSRVTAYLNPWEDPQGSGFQIIQSLLAFGSGGIHGSGLGQSTQKLFYLPAGYNDFILSIIGEELGLAGVLAILFLYAVILVCGIMIARKTDDEFKKLMVLSVVLLIVLQALINMLVATGLIPTKGLPLPFISYGGTSLVFNLMAMGFLLSLDRSIPSK